mgnify:CR=1 FL=1|tara:strand:+ start:109 stop:567 length:459 start_codon:yes stop_codon:yes gene_type:complete
MSGAGFLIYKKNKFNENSFLLLKAIDNENKLGNKCFDIPKGGVDPGETEYISAVRELEEEAGLTLEDIEILKDDNMNPVSFYVPAEDHAERLSLMIGKIKDESLSKITLNKNPYKEHSSFTWKSCYKCENICLKYLKDTFNIGEFLIKNHER